MLLDHVLIGSTLSKFRFSVGGTQVGQKLVEAPLGSCRCQSTRDLQKLREGRGVDFELSMWSGTSQELKLGQGTMQVQAGIEV